MAVNLAGASSAVLLFSIARHSMLQQIIPCPVEYIQINPHAADHGQNKSPALLPIEFQCSSGSRCCVCVADTVGAVSLNVPISIHE
eukprot:1162051-Pelagomonas_calceolata.AAC.18